MNIFQQKYLKIITKVTRCICERMAQNVGQFRFCQNNCIYFTVLKSSPQFGLLLNFSNKLAKVGK
jgi:hypothetical protein